ncbi:MAG: hypothetical protein U0944_02430 [Candidatus Moranbacteria bacterium]|nr:hypothetical protein [bacterium]MDP1833688.1 hypothetical protein [Candidatus Moranbacteria bacterium]MDZ4385255.1 hypothetical protein [Candidatus Moranbacteria bacterium]
MLSEAAGYLSGIAIASSFVPYIRDVFSGKTKPERISWLIWAILGLIAFSSQAASGASYSLVMTGVQFFGDMAVFILAIRYGFGGFLRRDFWALMGASASLFLWYLTDEPAFALFLVIFIDAIGVVLTIIKTYENPETETISTWVFTSAAGFLGCLAVGSLDFILLAFPLYICLAGLAILAAIRLGFRSQT